MTPTKEQLEQAVHDGLTQEETANRIGCAESTVYRHAKLHGIHWPHRGDFQTFISVVIDGKRMTLMEAAARYGVNRKTIYIRYWRGRRGRDLVCEPQHGPAPRSYELGLTGRDWQIIADYARERTVNAASKRFSVPDGAIMAYLRGEEHRLA